MSTYTKYPNQVDTSTELPKATDLVTPVNGEGYNRLREAILAVENELGAQPSGTWSTVRARLDAMDTALLSLGADVDQIDPTIEILQDGSSINANANAINFTGNVQVTDDGSGVSVEIIGGQATQEQETFIATDGQTSFTLSEEPFQTNGVHMYVNGVKMRYGADYTVSGTSVSYLDDLTLVAGDEVEFWYLVDSAGLVMGGGSVLIVRDEGVVVDTETTALNFTGDFTITSVSPGIVEIGVTAAGAALEVQDEGVAVDSAVTTLNFTGDATITNPSPGVIDISITAGASVGNPWNTTDQVINDSNTLTLQSATDINIDAANNVTISATGSGIYFDATAGGEFYPSAEYIYIESLGFLDMVSEDGITMYQIRRTGDLPAQAIHLQGAQASATAVGATNRTGGSLIFEAGAATTPGTDASGPIYFGLGTPVTGYLAGGIKLGYGAAVGILGDTNYVPYTTELAGIRLQDSGLTIDSLENLNLYSATDVNVFSTAGNLSFSTNSGAILFDNTSGASNIEFTTSAQFAVYSAPFYISNTDSASAAEIYSAGTLATESRSNMTVSVRPFTADVDPPAWALRGAQAGSSTTGTNRVGGSIILETGRGRTPGTDHAGPIYFGIGDAVSTSITSGFILGYGTSVGTFGASDYVPFTTELARHTLVSDEYKISSSKNVRIASVANSVKLESTAGATSGAIELSAPSTSTIVIAGGGLSQSANGSISMTAGSTGTYTSASTAQLISTGGAAHLVAPAGSVSSLNGDVQLRCGNRTAKFQNYGASEDRIVHSFPAYVATTAVTKVALFTSTNISTSRPVTFRGSVAGWPASGAGQYVDIFLHAENIAGTVSIIGSVLTGSGATLGTVTAEVSALAIVIYVEPVDITAYTWRCTMTEER